MLKRIMKKASFAVIICVTILSVGITSYASTSLNLNNGNKVSFNKLLIVDNGITYVPLRMAFTQNMGLKKDGTYSYGDNPYYGITVNPFIGDCCVTMGLRRKDAEGNPVNNGRFVKIEWTDEVRNSNEEWKNGRIQFIKYDVVNGENVMSEWKNDYKPYAGLESEVKLIPVDETGDRLFLSVGDLQKIANFLTDGNNYQVDIIAE